MDIKKQFYECVHMKKCDSSLYLEIEMLQNINGSEKKIGFIFYHGWGYNGSYWKNIAPLFRDFSCIFCDAGYFGDSIVEPHEHTEDISWIGVGHSIGFVKLLKKNNEHMIKLSAIVGIQSFLNFLGNDIRLNKNRFRILERMISAFEKVPIRVLEEFKNNSKSFQLDTDKINSELLLQDLELLKLNFSIPYDLPSLIIASENDPIVDNALIKDNFFSDENKTHCDVEFINCNGHTLGYDNPKAVYDCIMNFVKKCRLIN